jgi:hypothetical protein
MVSVVVGCALPQGVVLQLGHMVDAFENTPMGARPIRKFQKAPGEPLTLPGNAADLISQNPAAPLTYGYRLTRFEGEKAEYFLAWVKMQQEADKHHPGEGGLLESRAIIWHEESDQVELDATKLITRDNVKFGLEPLDPNNLPPALRSQRLKMETAEDQRQKPQRLEPVAFIDAETGRRGYGEKPKPRVRRNGNGRNGNGRNGIK